MKAKNKNKKMTLFQKILALTLLLIGCVVAYSPTAVTLGTASLAVIPFVFTVPDALQKSMKTEEIDGLKALAKQFETFAEDFAKGLFDEKTLSEKMGAAFNSHLKEFGMEKESFKTLQQSVTEMGITLKGLKDAAIPEDEKPKSLVDQVKSFQETDDFKAFLNKKNARAEFELKAAQPMSSGYGGTPATIVPANQGATYGNTPELYNIMVDRNIRVQPKEAPLFWGLLAKGNVDAVAIIWFNRSNVEGNAAFRVEYGLRPLISWTVSRETTSPEMASVSVKISKEMLSNATFIASQIDKLLRESLTDRLDLLSWNFIYNNAYNYSGTGLDGKIDSPNNADAIRAVVLMLRNLHFKPDVLLLSPTDVALIDLTKNGTGNYMKQEIDALLKNLTIKEHTDIPDGTFALIDTSKIEAHPKGNVIISTGNGTVEVDGKTKTDFEVGAVTLAADQEYFLYMDELDTLSIVYDNFATVKEALASA